jgi:hypothetical protein
MWCLSYPPSARRDRPISLARSRRAPRPQSNASDHLRQCRHDASAIERYGRLSDLPPPKDAQPANEVEWKRPRMCTGERTRELHSGPARAGGGLDQARSLASSISGQRSRGRNRRDDQICGKRGANGASVVGPGAATSLATLADWWKHHSAAPDRKPWPVELAPGVDPWRTSRQ